MPSVKVNASGPVGCGRTTRIGPAPLLAIGILLCLIWSAALFLVEADRAQTEQEVTADNNLLVRSLEEHVRRTLGAADHFLLLAKHEYEAGQSVTPSLRRQFDHFHIQMPIANQAVLAGRDGSILLTTGTVFDLRQDMSGRQGFARHRETDSGRMYIGVPGISPFSGESILPLSRRLNGPDGSFAGVVGIMLNMDYFTKFYDDMGMKSGQIVRIVGLDGVVRASRFDDAADSGSSMLGTTLFKEAAQRPAGTFFSAGKYTGQPGFRSYRTMPDYPLIVATGIATETALAEFYYRRPVYFAGAAVISIAILLVAFLVGRRAAREAQAADALRRSEAQYRLLAENITDVIAQYGADGVLTYVSPSVQTLLGWSAEELTGRSIYSFIRPEDTGLRTELEEQLHGGAPFVRFETLLTRKDGATVWIEAVSRLVSSPEPGQRPEILTVARDVTERKSHEESRLAFEKEAATLERLASLGTMAASVTHEINQPLQAISLTADSFLYWHEKSGRVQSPERVAELFRTVSAQTQRISNIVRRLRAFIRPEDAAPLALTDVNACVAGALGMVGTQLAGHGIEVRTSLDPALFAVRADSSRLEEGFINILINALHALDSVSQQEKFVHITTTASPYTVTIVLANNGPEIPSAVLPQIFQPFYTTKTRADGLGLGLHIVRRSIQSFGGSITVENKEPGVVFTISLPKPEVFDEVSRLLR